MLNIEELRKSFGQCTNKCPDTEESLTLHIISLSLKLGKNISNLFSSTFDIYTEIKAKMSKAKYK